MMQKPLRGELTLPSPLVYTHGSAGAAFEEVQIVLSQIMRLSSSKKFKVKVLGTEDTITTSTSWSWTNAEILSAESALLPVLVHLAVARNDIEALIWCIESSAYEDVNSQSTDRTSEIRAAGIVNCIDAASGRSPLHVAALHGNQEATILLLDAGASVHVRDSLDHTALYYVGSMSFTNTVANTKQSSTHCHTYL